VKPPIARPQRRSPQRARAVVAAFAVLATAGVAARLAAPSSAATDSPSDAPASAAAANSVLLFTWDTTRADRIGAYGHARSTTPGFDALAREGLLYERAYAAAPVTLPSHTTILSGVYPPAHGVRDNAIFRVGEGSRLLSEAL
jgi:predicted AlkP superfamily pyrophosphatase or phosphodiesterase